jgi:hypothetical protein
MGKISLYVKLQKYGKDGYNFGGYSDTPKPYESVVFNVFCPSSNPSIVS